MPKKRYLSFFISLCLIVITMVTAVQANTAEEVITNGRVSMLSSARVYGSAIQSLRKGTYLKVLSKRDGWMRVRTSGGKEGYVDENWVTSSAGNDRIAKEKGEKRAAKAAAGKVLTKYPVKLLARQDLSSRPIADLGKNSALKVISRDGIWLKVRTSTGQSGYVAQKWVSYETNKNLRHVATNEFHSKKDNKEVEISRIENELKNIPVSKYSKNLKLYEKLFTLDPTSSKYKSKVSFYKSKIEKAAEKSAAEVVKKEREAKQRARNVKQRTASEKGVAEKPAVEIAANTGIAKFDFEIHSSSSMQSRSLKSLSKEEILNVVKVEDNDWYKVEHEGMYGWIHSNWVKETAAAEVAKKEREAKQRARSVKQRTAKETTRREKYAREKAAREKADAEKAAAGKAAADTNMDILFSNKWSASSLPCGFNGGTFIEYGYEFATGERFTANGKPISDSSVKAWKEFIKNSDGTITLKTKIWDIFGEIGSVGTKVFRLEGDKLHVKYKYKMRDYTNIKTIKYDRKEENSTQTNCEATDLEVSEDNKVFAEKGGDAKTPISFLQKPGRYWTPSKETYDSCIDYVKNSDSNVSFFKFTQDKHFVYIRTGHKNPSYTKSLKGFGIKPIASNGMDYVDYSENSLTVKIYLKNGSVYLERIRIINDKEITREVVDCLNCSESSTFLYENMFKNKKTALKWCDGQL